MQPTNREKAVEYLRALTKVSDPAYRRLVADQERALAAHGELFRLERVSDLNAAEFNAFLRYENDRHWWGAGHHAMKRDSQMPSIRQALTVLLDESAPVADRLDTLVGEDGRHALTALDQDAVTPILAAAHPTEYGVWNALSRSGMHYLGLYPSLRGSGTFGAQYGLVNRALRTVAREVGVDLATLDGLWWLDETRRNGTTHQAAPPDEARTRRSTRRKSPSRPRPALRISDAIFVCAACFGTKVEHLRVPDTDICVDCVER